MYYGRQRNYRRSYNGCCLTQSVGMLVFIVTVIIITVIIMYYVMPYIMPTLMQILPPLQKLPHLKFDINL